MTAGLTRSLRASSLSLGVLCLATLAVRAETPLERGTYLMQSIVACGNCHTPKDGDGKPIADRELAGGFVIDAPVFHSVSPNITPDKETGIGNWTDDQIVDAIRNGKRPDGTIIGPPMPIAYYRNLSDSDVRAIVAYLRTVKPIKNKTEKSTYKIPLPAQYGPTVRSPACPICRAPTKPHTADISRRRSGIAWTATPRWSMAAAIWPKSAPAAGSSRRPAGD